MISIGSTQARQQFAELLDRAQDEPVFVERRGQAHVVVVSMHHYEVMQAALEDAEDVDAFDAAMAEEGTNIPWDRVKVDLGWA